MVNFNKIKEDFPFLSNKVNGKQVIYFDNAATSQKPKQVIEAMNDYYFNYCANIHRGVHKFSVKATKEYEEAHRKVAKFIGVNEKQVIFTRNTTEALNLIYYSWAYDNLKEGDEVITTVMEHHSNIVPLFELKKRKNINVKFVGINEDGTLKLDDYNKLITKKTKLITVAQVSNVLGTINPIKEISKIAKDNKSLFIVDGAQSVPHMSVKFKELNADFLAFSAHKMLGPTGVGALVGKEELLEKMPPFLSGGDMIEQVHVNSWKANKLPWKFEAGTGAIAEGIGFGAAIDYLERVGIKDIREHEKELTKHAIKKIKEINEIELYGPLNEDIRAGVISFNIKGMRCHEVAGILDQAYNIACRSGALCAQPLIDILNPDGLVRASFYLYNDKEEIDVFINALKKVVKHFK